jgi:hypothetical protein
MLSLMEIKEKRRAFDPAFANNFSKFTCGAGAILNPE